MSITDNEWKNLVKDVSSKIMLNDPNNKTLISDIEKIVNTEV